MSLIGSNLIRSALQLKKINPFLQRQINRSQIIVSRKKCVNSFTVHNLKFRTQTNFHNVFFNIYRITN